MKSPKAFRELSPIRQDAARYCADNRPKLRRKEELPDNEHLLALFDDQPEIQPGRKEFPPYRAHKKACRLLGRNPFPQWQPGTPEDIKDKLRKTTRSQATIDVLDYLYTHSGYDPHREASTCQTRNKIIAKHIGRTEKTVKEATRYLLKGHWIERPRTGVPAPKHESGYQSLYVLPFSYPHILRWRSQPNKRRKK